MKRLILGALLISASPSAVFGDLCAPLLDTNGKIAVGRITYDLKNHQDRAAYFDRILQNPKAGDYAVWNDSLGYPHNVYVDVIEPAASIVRPERGGFGAWARSTKEIIDGMTAVFPRAILKNKIIVRDSKVYDLSVERDLYAYIKEVKYNPKVGDVVVLASKYYDPRVVTLEKVVPEEGFIIYRDGSGSGIKDISDIVAPFILP